MALPRTHRLHHKQNALFSGQLIDRERPIHFQLDGRNFEGYQGDTILSAILGAGVDTIGEVMGDPIALIPDLCPPVSLTQDTSDSKIFLPMDRTPALDGMKLQSLWNPNSGRKPKPLRIKNIAKNIWRRHKRSLEFDFSGGIPLPGPWVEQNPTATKIFDLVIVGGGIAGLSAALAGINKGWRVGVIEQQSMLGGDARFFGAIEEEKRPDAFVKELLLPLQASDICEIFTSTVAIALNTQGVNVHQVSIINEKVKSRNFHLSTSRVILATGMLERLPVFPGNRTPGVVSARTAFQLASKYGVWKGKSAAFCTSSSPATQVALLAADMGVDVKKLADSRTNPKSRFFEFAKAYGISLATGSQVVSAIPIAKGKLSVQFGLTDEPSRFTGDALEIDRLVVCGGWQPNLILWHNAGGATHWVAEQQQLQALELQSFDKSRNIQLAGSVKGAMSMTECVASGEYAVEKLVGTKISPAKFTLESFESADGQLPVATPLQYEENCYLDTGYSLNKPHLKVKSSIWRQFVPVFGETKHPRTIISNGFSLNDVVAKVILGEIPQEHAGMFAQERCGISGNLDTINVVPNTQNVPDIAERNIPAYLIGRFGKNAEMHELEIPDDINLELGSLIYPNRENYLPVNAIGTVISVGTNSKKHALAYLNIEQITDASHVVIRYGTQAIKVKVGREILSQ